MKQPQSGNALAFGLMALVLATIGIAIAVGQFRVAERSLAIQRTVTDLSSMMGQITTVFGKYAYRDLTETMVIEAGIVPANLLLEQHVPKRILTQFYSEINIGPIQAGALRGAYLRYNDLPADMCQQVIFRTQHLAWGVQIDFEDVKTPDSQLNIEQVGLLCGAQTDTVNIQWFFGSPP